MLRTLYPFLAIQDERERIKEEKKRANDQAREAVSKARQEARTAEKHILTIGESIYNFRISHRLNQSQCAKLLGCSAPSIGNWEHDKNTPRKAIIEKISELEKATGYQ